MRADPRSVSGRRRRMRQPAGGIAIVRDISERRLAEQALGERGRAGAILQAALDAVITIDRRGRVLEFNPAAERPVRFPAAAACSNAIWPS